MNTHVDWASLLASEAKTRAVLRADELAVRHKLAYGSVIAALVRQERRGLVEHVVRNIYLNKLALGYSGKDFVNVVDPHSYVSLSSALLEWGVSTQSPIGVTCVTTSRPRTIRTASLVIEFTRIRKELFWGSVERKGRYGVYKIAEPEKALLDWVYLGLQTGSSVHLDELHFEPLNLAKLVELGKKFPRSVFETILPTVLERCLPGQTVVQSA
jgi:predicted transcriptional regulator of viral defense system